MPEVQLAFETISSTSCTRCNISFHRCIVTIGWGIGWLLVRAEQQCKQFKDTYCGWIHRHYPPPTLQRCLQTQHVSCRYGRQCNLRIIIMLRSSTCGRKTRATTRGDCAVSTLVSNQGLSVKGTEVWSKINIWNIFLCNVISSELQGTADEN